MLQLFDLPDVILFEIVSFVAPPLHRSYVICHQLAPLCKQYYNRFILINTQHPSSERSQTEDCVDNKGRDCSSNLTSIWDSVLRHDYDTSAFATNNHNHQTRRASKRLRQSTFDIVKSVHENVVEMTENAFFWLNTLTSCSGGYRTDYGTKLSLQGLKRIFDQYGPKIIVNKILSNGSTFLVEVCRSRNVREIVILNCIKELLINWSANINIQTNESKTSKQTVLCVAAARGMSTIVQYLLTYKQQRQKQQQDITTATTKPATTSFDNVVDTQIVCSGRFYLHSSSNSTGNGKQNKKIIFKCVNKTALQFAMDAKNGEIFNGCCEKDLKGLVKVIKLLQNYEKQQTTTTTKNAE